MHPMFVKLFIETDADDLPAEAEWRRRAPVPASPARHGHQARRREYPPRLSPMTRQPLSADSDAV